jgi:hypothetical protein
MADVIINEQNELIARIKENVTKIIDEAMQLQQIVDAVKSIRSVGDAIRLISVVYTMIQNVVLAVEIAFNDAADFVEGLKSEDKLEVAVQALDDAFVFWPILELFDDSVFRIMLSLAVQGLNRQFGNDWDLDKAREALKTGKDFIDTVLNPE